MKPGRSWAQGVREEGRWVRNEKKGRSKGGRWNSSIDAIYVSRQEVEKGELDFVAIE